MSETRYTLSEAATIQRQDECRRHGHSWDIAQNMAGPLVICCSSCGWTGSVTMGERPARPEGQA